MGRVHQETSYGGVAMKLGGSRNQCQGCKQYFNSNKGFDRHRIGAYGVNRRCRTTEEMLKKGWSINADGFWITETNAMVGILTGEINEDLE